MGRSVRSFALIVTATLIVTAALTEQRVTFASEAKATSPAADDQELRTLLGRLEAYGQRFEQMKKRGSYTFAGRLDRLDGDGKVDGTQELVLRISANPAADASTQVLRYTDDGEDKTAEAQARAKARASKPKDKKRDFKLPFTSSERPRYVFTLVERSSQGSGDHARPKVRIAFVPKVPAEDAYHGSAWIDVNDAEVDSMGFSPSKNPTFIDHIDVTMLFALQTPLGRAPSLLTVDARGGFLFVRRHYRGTGTISDPQLLP